MSADFAKEVIPIAIEQELKQSYLDYAMSVIVGRALPDVRDGFKPVHRRVLFAMHELSNHWNKAYKKSARVVGDVIGKYHPHGESAVYDALVRMAQPFSMRYVLVDGQGNFGSVDGDAAAAMRYTEVRMSRMAHLLLEDLEKDTVDFIPNYDGSEFYPSVLPARIPNLLVNGASGIAVGMATNIPPHNLGEVLSACLLLLEQPELSVEALARQLPGPDFPTSGMIYGREGILSAYRTGRGRVMVRARAHIEEDERSGKESIIVTELPYQVNKARLLEKIAELVREKRLEGVTALRDESDKDGMRVVVELRRGESSEVMLNQLYSLTPMETSFGVNMVALVDGRPKLLNLKEVLWAFICHRSEVVTRRSRHDLKKAKARAQILEGLAVALGNIDAVIALIKASKSPQEAREALLGRLWPSDQVLPLHAKLPPDLQKSLRFEEGQGITPSGYQLTLEQTDAILELRLHRLTGLEQDKMISEYEEQMLRVQDLHEILSSPDRLKRVIRTELEDMKKYSDPRKTEILDGDRSVSMEDCIPDDRLVITLSHAGYIKSQLAADYEAQHRGGRGRSATALKDEDHVVRLLVADAHDTLLLLTSHGKLYWLRAWDIPSGSRQARGKPIVNVLPLSEGEHVQTILSLRHFSDDRFIVFATQKGTVKKVALSAFSKPRSAGIIAIDLDEDDALVGAVLTEKDSEIMLFSNLGKAVRCAESDIRAMGRQARGVRGMHLPEGAHIVSLLVPKPETMVLTLTEKGYGKRTHAEEFRKTARGAQGVTAMNLQEHRGQVMAALAVHDHEDLLVVTDAGTLIRTPVSEIAKSSRNTQGVRVIRVADDERVVQAGVIPSEEKESPSEPLVNHDDDTT